LSLAHKAIETLQRQLQAANGVAMQRGLGASGAKSARAAASASDAAIFKSSKASPRGFPRPPSPRNALINGALGLGGIGRSEGRGGGPPMTKEEKLAARLSQLDPGAAAAMQERKGQMAQLRQRLVAAQAQSAVEQHTSHRTGGGGAYERDVTSDAHARVRVD
jgi:hypothetical protein